MPIIVHVPRTVLCSRTTCYRSSLIGFLTSLPVRVVYKGGSLASTMSDEGGTSPAGISSAAEGFKWYSCGECFVCGLAGNVGAALVCLAQVLSAERCFHDVSDIPYETLLGPSSEPLDYT